MRKKLITESYTRVLTYLIILAHAENLSDGLQMVLFSFFNSHFLFPSKNLKFKKKINIIKVKTCCFQVSQRETELNYCLLFIIFMFILWPSLVG